MKKGTTYHSDTLFDQLKDSQFSVYKEIVITSKGIENICLVDPKDYELVCHYRWNLHSEGYAVTKLNRKTVLMHRLILGVTDPEIQVDHKFHNKLDNRRAKIRICTPSENRRNSQKLKDALSKFKGVYKDGRYWHAQIMQDGKVKNLGRFRSEATAAKVYDIAARLFFRDFAFLNFPDYQEPEQFTFFFD